VDEVLKDKLLSYSVLLLAILIIGVGMYFLRQGIISSPPNPVGYQIGSIKIGQTVDVTNYQYHNDGSYSFAIPNKQGNIIWYDSEENMSGTTLVYAVESSKYKHLRLKRIANYKNKAYAVDFFFPQPAWMQARYVLMIPKSTPQ